MTYQTEVAADNPTRYWKFDEPTGSYATSIGTNSGTTIGTPTRVMPGIGDGEYAIGFPSVSSYFQMGAVGTIPATAARSAFSYECWFKSPVQTTPGSGMTAQQIIGTDCSVDTFGRQSWSTRMLLTAGADLGKIQAAVTSGTDQDALKTALRYDDNAWHHAVVTYDGTNVRLYMDGVLNGTAAHTVAINPGSNPPTVGYQYASFTTPATYPANVFTGVIDGVAIYETVLNATRILAHYTEGIKQYVKWYQWNGTVASRLSVAQWNGTASVPLTSTYKAT